MNNLPEFLSQLLETQYGSELALTIQEGYRAKRFTTFRINTIKATIEEVQDYLQKEQIQYETVPWSKEAILLKTEKEKEIRQLSLYEEGKIYLQSLSSMLPPILLEPREGECILDMAAAPGSKTTQLAALSKNQAMITACEKNAIRAERLTYNLKKQGVTSTYVMVTDSSRLDDLFSFDKILLDAPCSGSGTIDLENSALEKVFTKKLVEKSMQTQLALLKKAIKLLKPGKEMIYSTCSILACENEEIIKQALKGVKAHIEPIKKDGFETIPFLPTQLEGTLCICPNEKFEGFFVAKIRKD